jgi:methionine-R-sulfoxide reductase
MSNHPWGNEETVLQWADVVTIAKRGNPKPPRRVERTDAEWRAQLAPDVYQVTRQKGTEAPFSSEMCNLFEPGRYACACCDTLLFESGDKFDSGTGWPSFTQPADPSVIAYRADHSHGMDRVETTCNVCDAHLGHVFPDGPAPSGLRYCINAVALRKVAQRSATADPA